MTPYPDPTSITGHCVSSKVTTEESWRQKKEQLHNFISCSDIHIIKANKWWGSYKLVMCNAVRGKYSWFHLLRFLQILGHRWCLGDPWCSFHLVRSQMESTKDILYDTSNRYNVKWMIIMLGSWYSALPCSDKSPEPEPEISWRSPDPSKSLGRAEN